VLTIGNFDGVHLGHRRIVELARTLAGERGGGRAVVAMTFEPPPDLVLRPENPTQRVVPPAVKGRLLLEAGCDYVVTAKADRALLGLEPAEFIRQVIVGRFAPRHIVEGPNFFFGRRRAGDIETLRSAGAAAGFEVYVAEPVRLELGAALGHEVVSSTLIRRLVAAGRVQDAARCLGRAFALYGPVVAGAGVGRKLGFPTANIAAGEQVCPGDGVYAGWAEIEGRRYAAAVSVGTRPTFGEDVSRTIEAFLLDASGDLYDRDMVLGFVRRLRDQRRFDGPEALTAQMAKDVEEVRRIVQ
jgi:riboflavin kinase/FMN adenylyltransferase